LRDHIDSSIPSLDA